MRPTRRLFGILGVGIVFVAFGLILARPVLILGAGILGVWVLADQYRFARSLFRIDEDATLTQSLSTTRVVENASVELTLTGRVPTTDLAETTVRVTPPVAIEGVTEYEFSIEDGQLTEIQSFSIPLAGRHVFEGLSLSTVSANRLFTESVRVSEPLTLRVDPRQPRDIHVGVGGEQVAAYGEHPAQRGQRSTESSGLRAYQPGDPANQIDWNATARRGDPFIRKFETQAERRTLLVVDHRTPMGDGDAGESKLDYARELTLTITEDAEQNDDPLGLTTVGDEGLTGVFEPAAIETHYGRLRTRLQDLTPTQTKMTSMPGLSGSPELAHQNARRLQASNTNFAETLTPFFEHAETYVERLSGDPLYHGVETATSGTRGTPWVVILTDDTHRVELREAVKLARRRDRIVSVFIAPSVLFETHGLRDFETAYDRYADFEDYRRSIDQIDHVRAYEYAPGDRVAALLASRRAQSSLS